MEKENLIMSRTSSAAYADVGISLLNTGSNTLDRNDIFKFPLKAIPNDDIQFTTVTVVKDRSEWLNSCVNKLSKLSKLDDDWNSYGAEKPNQWSLDSAYTVLASLVSKDLKPSSIDASVEGGICLSFQTDSRYGDIECFNSGEIFAVTSINGNDTEAWEIDKQEYRINSAISRIQHFLEKK